MSNTTHELLDKAYTAWHVMNSVAGKDLGIEVQVDEVALLFETQLELLRFKDEALQMGCTSIGSVTRDHMHRQDQVDNGFDVRFEFLQLQVGWRIEAMCVLWGHAPLHKEALRALGSGGVVHASYKLADRAAYDAASGYGLERRTLATTFGVPIDVKAEYENSYGRFSYFRYLDYPYLKPRVNLRDTQK